MNTMLKMTIAHGRKYSIFINLLSGSLNLIAYAATKRKSCLVYTVGSAACVLLLTSDWFKKLEEEVNNSITD